MRKVRVLTSALLIILLGFAWLPNPGAAQSNTSAEGEISSGEDLLTEEELQTLVSPIALYPDTLLNQVLVASTYPLEVIKADQYREDHSETDPETFQSDIETKGWDASVTVLATAFPDVLSNMSDHIDWTDAMGTAMLAQDEDVMDAVQVMRAQADQAGNLESGEEQTVEVTKENNGEQTIIIQPADPQVVYVPQYNTDTVYVEDTSSNSNDVATAALLGFGSAILINEIFDDDDDWNDYWGCRNCGGWGGRPMYRDPDVDIDINGDVNIGNEIKKGRKGWKADEKRKKDAKRKVKKRKNKDGKARMPDRQPNRGDKMRKDLAKKSGKQDISGKGNREARSKAQRDAARVPERHKDAIDRTKPKKKANAKSSGKKNASNKSRKKDVAKSKSTKKAAAKPKSKSKTKAKARTAKKPVKKPKSASKSAMKKKSHAPRAKSASKRGKKAKGHKKKRKG